MDQLWHLSLGGASCVLVIARGVPAQLCAFASAGNRSMGGGNVSSKLPEQRNLAHAQAAERVATPTSQTLPLDCYFEVTVVPRIWTPSCTGVVPRENIFRTWTSRGPFPLLPTRSLSRSVTAQNKKAPDRKSTRLNSSHTVISYAVFCLKK